MHADNVKFRNGAREAETGEGRRATSRRARAPGHVHIVPLVLPRWPRSHCALVDRVSAGFSAQQGGAALVDQGGFMVLQNCEFQGNFAGPDHRDIEATSAHDVVVGNYGKLIIEAATPTHPEVRMALQSWATHRRG